jgi:hypothetical protein
MPRWIVSTQGFSDAKNPLIAAGEVVRDLRKDKVRVTVTNFDIGFRRTFEVDLTETKFHVEEVRQDGK